MTKQLEALIAEMKAAAEKQDKYLKGGAFSIDWDDSITPKNILALIAALEQSQQQITSLFERVSGEPITNYPPDTINWLADIIEGELDASDGALDAAKKRIAELEASQSAVELPPKFNVQMGGDEITRIAFRERNTTIDECAKAIRAAGGTVQGDK